MESVFIIGDIHGEIRLLDRLLKEIESFRPERKIFIGDYIDRGPHSRMVIDRLMEMGDSDHFLMGNHELMLLNAIENMAFGYSPVELWYYNGAEATLQSFGSNSFFSFQSDLEGKYLDFFRRLEMNVLLETGMQRNILVTHAGVSPAIPFSDQLGIKDYRDLHNYILKKHLDPGEAFIWVRDDFFYAAPELWDQCLVIHGHTPVNKLHRFAEVVNNGEWQFHDGDIGVRIHRETGIPISVDIDSGSTISGRLSGLGIFIQKEKMDLIGVTVSKDDVIKRDIGTI